MENRALLQVTNLTHTYGIYQVLSAIDLSLYAGEITALYGSNGSGKTTLLQCLTGLLKPTSGEILVDGNTLFSDERMVKRDLAFVPDVPLFYTEFTAWEHLLFIASAHHAMEGFNLRAESLLKEFGLWEARDLYPHHYSRGMSLKLGLVLALIRPHKVLLLDEPTSALDAGSTAQLIKHLQNLASQGVAILVSTHDPGLFSSVSNHVYHLENGGLRLG
jgi:ABC-type multidrug transport system ATPase subunit